VIDLIHGQTHATAAADWAEAAIVEPPETAPQRTHGKS
jgi:hypothetical protein